MFPSLLLQSESDFGSLIGGFVILILVLFILSIVATVLVAIWIARDANRRGESGPMWATLFVLGAVFFSLIGGLVVVIIWLFVRPKQFQAQQQQVYVMPGAPPPTWNPQTQQWQPNPAAGYAPPAPSYAPPPPAYAPAPPSYAPPPATLGKMSKVKCPRCQTIFEFQRQPVGRTHVKCPACGEEGDI